MKSTDNTEREIKTNGRAFVIIQRGSLYSFFLFLLCLFLRHLFIVRIGSRRRFTSSLAVVPFFSIYSINRSYIATVSHSIRLLLLLLLITQLRRRGCDFWLGFDKPRAIGKVLWSEWWLAVDIMLSLATSFESNATWRNFARAFFPGDCYYKLKNSEFQNFARFLPRFFSSLSLSLFLSRHPPISKIRNNKIFSRR